MDFQNTGMESTNEVFTMTRSSGLNDLISEARKLYEDDFDPDFYIDDYRAKLDSFKELMDKLRELHANMVKIQEDVPLIKEQNKEIDAGFERLFEGLKTMENYLEYGEKEGIVRGLTGVKAANEGILKALDAINEESAKLTRYSPSPLVHELIRVARGVLDKGFPRDALKEKLEGMQAHCDYVARDFHIIKSSRCETAAIEARMPQVEEAFNKLREGLRIMEEYFSDDEAGHIEKAIPMLVENSTILADFTSFVELELQESTTKLCVKCGTENDKAAKFCSSCSAILPGDNSASIAADMAIKSDEFMKSNEDRVFTTNIIVLMNAVQDHCSKRMSREKLLKVIEWMEEKVREGIEGISSMDYPEGIENAEEQEALEKTRVLLEEGAYGLEAALAEMRLYYEDNDQSHLKAGLEQALEASDRRVQVQENSKFALTSS